MNTFFIADPHFGHEAIIRYENRPWKSAQEMDRDLIARWNGAVGEADSVYVLGDLSLHGRERTAEIVRSLRGVKHMLIGNHDERDVMVYYEMGFHRAYDLPVILDDFWILSHEPVYVNSNMPYANIFGHVHSSGQYTDQSRQSFCVSAERIAYTPIAFQEIKRRMGLSDIQA